LAGVRGTKSALNDRLAKFYWFLFQRVSEAKINSDAQKLAETTAKAQASEQKAELIEKMYTMNQPREAGIGGMNLQTLMMVGAAVGLTFAATSIMKAKAA